MFLRPSAGLESHPILEFRGLDRCAARLHGPTFANLQKRLQYLHLSEKKTGKGIQRAYLKQNISHDDYRRCLLSDKRQDQQQLASFHTIRSRQHQLGSYEINKVGLCCFDNKRYLLDDGITSYSYGHHRIGSL